jgi:hypothetical protein
MKMWRDLALTFLFTLLVWAVFSWPLPRFFCRAIPSSAENVEHPPIRRMIQGDHLQLLYNYWLVADMTSGKTPWATNPYEFNAGADAPLRREAWGNLIDQPFTALFSLGYRLGGRAFAWNLTGFIALWITFFATWMLLRHFCANDPLAFLAATPVLIIPFRWANLLGGSPMGFAMMWVPLLLWGLSTALFNRRWIGAVGAALAIGCMRWSDTHVFFFSVIALPAWVLFIALADRAKTRAAIQAWPGTLARLAVPALTAGFLIILGQIQKHTQLAETTIGGGRSWSEIALYSPHLNGLWSWPARGIDSQIFLGYGFLLFLSLMGIVSLILLFRDRERRETHLASLCLLAGIAVLVLLALGVNGPHEAAPFRLARKWIPPYSMVRQPAKIFCLLPTFGAVAIALFFAASRHSRTLLIAGLLLLIAFATESKIKIRPTLCLIDTQQAAYQAVADSAAQAGTPPHALIVPLWPGDSSWASLYEHYASLYRIRMLNGYTPIVPHDYIRDVFDRFNSANGGHLNDLQLDDLLRRGVEYVLLHEDAFPEKVSYFPVAFTLHQFLNHPRLELMAHDQAVWSFRIRAKPTLLTSPVFPEWTIFFPTYVREMEWSAATPGQRRESEDALGKAYVSLSPEHPVLSLPSFEYLPIPESRFMVRLRGPGAVQWKIGGRAGESRQYVLATPNSTWEWQSLCFTNLPPTPEFTSTITRLRGQVDLDSVLYIAGRWEPVQTGQTVRLPAPLFFHAGYTDPETGCVQLDPEREPNGIVFYGLRLPVEVGHYQVELIFNSPATPGSGLGSWTLSVDGQSLLPDISVVAGQPSAVRVEVKDNRPIEFSLNYGRIQSLALKELIITRLAD